MKPKNWADFQHYKDRCPPWIKLHRELLNDRAFMMLPVESKALAPLLWLLASESKDGNFDGSIDELTFRLRLTPLEIEKGLKPLILSGFFIDDSDVLASCLQSAIPETEGESEKEAKKKTEKETEDSSFIDFWNVYDKKVAKPAAEKAWKKIKPNDDLLITILQSARKYVKSTPNKQYRKDPATWLNNQCWNDEIVENIPQKTQTQLNNEALVRSLGLDKVYGKQNFIEEVQDVAAFTPRLG